MYDDENTLNKKGQHITRKCRLLASLLSLYQSSNIKLHALTLQERLQWCKAASVLSFILLLFISLPLFAAEHDFLLRADETGHLLRASLLHLLFLSLVMCPSML